MFKFIAKYPTGKINTQKKVIKNNKKKKYHYDMLNELFH